MLFVIRMLRIGWRVLAQRDWASFPNEWAILRPSANGIIWKHLPGSSGQKPRGVGKFAKILEESRAGIRTHAETVGLKIDWDDLSSTLSPLASITQVPRAFDFESSRWPSQFHHTGPFHDGKGRGKVDFPWERLTGGTAHLRFNGDDIE